jgi:hypothetical protein
LIQQVENKNLALQRQMENAFPMNWWAARRSLSTALASTLLVLAFFSLLSTQEAEVLIRQKVMIERVQITYGLLILLLLPALVFEPQVRTFLQHGWTPWVVLTGSALTVALSYQLVMPLQTMRLFNWSYSWWLILVHLNLLAVLAIALVTKNPRAEPGETLHRKLTWFLAGVTGLLLLAYIASVGAFMPLDLPDEPWSASGAATYFYTGHLTNTYMGSAFGDPDIIFPRLYYLLMGLWLRLVGNTDFATLRFFSLLMIVPTMVVLSRAIRKEPVSIRWATLAILLSMTAFARASHNLRMDVLLAVYGACVLYGLLPYNTANIPRWRSVVVLGLVQFIGFQSIPTATVWMAAAIGLYILLEPGRQWRTGLRLAFLYGLICTLMLVIYVLSQLLPDVNDSLFRFSHFLESYSSTNNFASLSLEAFVKVTGGVFRFSMMLSPIEVISIVAGLIILIRFGHRKGIAIAFVVFVGVGLALMANDRFAYGYMTLFAPFAAYSIGQLMRWRLGLLVVTFVVLPSMASFTIGDMLHTIQSGDNQALIENDRPLLDLIPPGSTLIADDRLWVTLHPDRRFINWNGIGANRRVNGLDYIATLEYLNVDYVICSSAFASRCDQPASTGLFEAPLVLETPQMIYTIYKRLR